jgi:pyochelin synthetase
MLIPNIKSEAFPLTDIQQSYLMGRQSGFDQGPVASYLYVENIRTQIDLKKLQLALKILISRHDMLRVVFDENGMQRILPNVPEFILQIHDFREISKHNIEDMLKQIRLNMTKVLRNSGQWPLFDIQISMLPENKYCLHFYIDLLIADGCGIEVFFRELSLLYHDFNYALPKIQMSYRDFIFSLQKEESSVKFMEDKEYWLKKIPSLPPAPDLPVKVQSEKSVGSFRGMNFQVSQDRWKEIKTISYQMKVAPSSLICTLYCKVISHWSRIQNFTLNIMQYNRMEINSGINSILGNLSSNMLLNVDFRKRKSIQDYARDIHSQIMESQEHSLFTGVKVAQEMNRSSGAAPKALMPIVFVNPINFNSFHEYQNEQSSYFKWYGKDVHYQQLETPYVWLDQQIFEDIDGSLFVNWIALDEIFPCSMVQEMFTSYKNLLSFYNDWEDKNLYSLWNLIDNKDHIKNIEKLNSIDEFEDNGLLHEGFLQQVKKSPEKIAIINGDKIFNYKDIYNISLELSEQIKNKNIIFNSPIAVVMDKSWEQIVAVFGILFSGSYYIPIDATLPKERISQLIKSSQAVAIVTQEKFINDFSISEGIYIFIPKEEYKLLNKTLKIEFKQNPYDLAYIIFTSGSTGVPKGVMVEHRSAFNTIRDINERFAVNEKDSILCFASLSFDLSVYDIFGLLSCGAKLVIPLPLEMQDPGCWKRFIQEHCISIWNTAPPLMQMFVEYLHIKNENLSDNNIRLVLLSGDWIPVSLPEKIRSQFKDAEIVSLGGATEASIWSNFYKIEEIKLQCSSIPYGKPLKNQKMYVFGNDFEIRPAWVAGMIYIGGVGLARGYLNDLEKTNRAFVFHPTTDERLYCTGDFGRYLPSGDIEFLGRQDNQVKIHGYRVELCEIEAVMAKHPSIATAIVRVVGETSATSHLVCYLIFKSKYQMLDKEQKNYFINSEIREFISKKLPYYMVPGRYFELEHIPVTSNGKLDNRELLKLANFENVIDIKMKFPKTRIEKELAVIWQKLLKIDSVSIQSNFFQLGGQSFLAFQMMNQIYQKFGVQLQMNSLFQGGTIQYLSEKIEATGAFQNEIDQVLVHLQSGGSKESFFCVHPSGGNIFCYHELSKYFAGKRPFVGIQSMGLNKNYAENTFLEEIAKTYLEAIREQQNRGPYFLGGWSFGGAVAYEIARQLLLLGEEVYPVILIDSPIPYERKLPTSDYLEKWFQKDIGEGLNELEQTQKEKLFHIFKTNVHALSKYNPPKTEIPVVIFKARSVLIEELLQHPSSKEEDWGWKNLTNNVKNIIELDGDHYSILEKNSVKLIAESLEKLGIIPYLSLPFKTEEEKGSYYDE